MFTQPPDPQIGARRALGKVYALLYRLAEQTPEPQNETARPANFGEGTGQAAERLTHEKESQP